MLAEDHELLPSIHINPKCRVLPCASVTLAAVVALLGHSLPAFAEMAATIPPGELESKAAVLDEQGMSLLKQGNVVEACPKFAESYRARPGTGVQMRLALCYEQSGKTASAWHTYLDAAARAKKSGDLTVARLAQKRAEALEPRLSKLTLRLDWSAQEAFPFEITCDGTPLAPSALGEPLILDPGLHVIVASAVGRKRFLETIRVRENAAENVLTISLPELAHSAPPPISVPAPRASPEHWSTQHTAAVIAGSVGVVGLALGTYSGLRVAAKMSDARDRCGGGSSGCPPSAIALQDEARGPAHLSTAAFSVGALGIATGLVLWLTAPGGIKARDDVALRVSPVIARDTGGVAMFAQW